ncbi:IS66 family transposase, partial [Acetobacteraceae bacterium]|nr:IS66 family transposase [Acetobacteraceae bacterium]
HGNAPAVLSPICLQAVQRIDTLFDIERDINGHSVEERRTIRQALSLPRIRPASDVLLE